jgi:hypothetical protein
VRCSQVLSFSWIYMFMCVYMATIFFGQIFHRIYIYIVALPLPDINWLVVCFLLDTGKLIWFVYL